MAEQNGGAHIPNSAEPAEDAPPRKQKKRALDERELQLIQNGDTENHRNLRDHIRAEALRNALGWFMVVAIPVLGIAFLSMFIVWSWHLLATPNWHFLEDSQLTQIQTIVLSSVVMGTVQSYIARNL